MTDRSSAGKTEAPPCPFPEFDPVRAGDDPFDVPEKNGTNCWLWHRLWSAGPQLGYYDRASGWWRIGVVGEPDWYGVGVFPSHWCSQGNYRRRPISRSKEWWIGRIDSEPDCPIGAGIPDPTSHAAALPC